MTEFLLFSESTYTTANTPTVATPIITTTTANANAVTTMTPTTIVIPISIMAIDYIAASVTTNLTTDAS